MDRFTHLVIHHCKAIVAGTIVLALISVLMALFVSVNYNLASYLPESSESTRAIEVMEAQFDTAAPNARVMVEGLSVEEALTMKSELEAIPGVELVLWLDDVADLEVPLEAIDPELRKDYFVDGAALYEVVIASGEEPEAMAAIYELIGEDGHATGEAVSTAQTQNMAAGEVANAFAILIPLILLLLILSTRSWLEPLFFLLAIGVSILFNMGTNLFLGEVSYIAFTISPILQLAVSLDYAIFMLHAFHRARETHDDVKEAMAVAMKDSFSAIAASAATTTFGFAALGFMQFHIGADLGITLVKGIIFSFLSVMIFLPALTLVACRWVDKTTHRRFMPSFSRIGGVLRPLRIPMLILVIVLVVPCFLAQSQMDFTYGMGQADDPNARTVQDKAAIEEVYGSATPYLLLVPKGNVGKENALVAAIEEDPRVSSTLSYPSSVGSDIPTAFIADQAVIDEFYGDDYARIVVYGMTPNEGEEAFSLVEKLRSEAQALYGDEALLAGEPASLYDMRDVTSVDSRVTNAIAIVAILIVLLLTFRSLLLPLILIATIESAILINLSMPYFTGDSLNYLGFLVINTVQLGATVDYAILFTDRYLKNRRRAPVAQALYKTCGDTFKSILVSASILSLAGFVLWITSSNGIISILGLLLFRGTLLSFLMVVTFLPAALAILDKPIATTTRHARFFTESASDQPSPSLEAPHQKDGDGQRPTGH